MARAPEPLGHYGVHDVGMGRDLHHLDRLPLERPPPSMSLGALPMESHRGIDRVLMDRPPMQRPDVRMPSPPPMHAPLHRMHPEMHHDFGPPGMVPGMRRGCPVLQVRSGVGTGLKGAAIILK